MSKPSAKPDTAKAAAPALPDAALLDREEEGADGTLPSPARTGIRRLLPSSLMGWLAVASLAFVTVGGSTAATLIFTLNSAPPAPASSTIAGPARVLSGGTLIVAGQTIQLHGIEAPPTSLICREGRWDYKCGEDSRRTLEVLIRERPVECEPSLAANGIIIGQCHSDQGIDLGAAMVEEGWAVADLRRSSRYLPQQTKAQDRGNGLWRNNFAYPEQWRLAARGDSR